MASAIAATYDLVKRIRGNLDLSAIPRNYLFENIFKRITGKSYGERSQGLPSTSFGKFATGTGLNKSIAFSNVK